MIIANRIQGMTSACSGSFEFAVLKDRCELIPREDPFACDKRDDIISLEDGKYRIEEGILFIKAKRVYWKYLPDYCEKIDVWSCRQIYLPNKSFQENTENPPEVKEVVIKRWWRNNKKFQGIELKPDDPTWYKQKGFTLFEIAIDNFRLNESNLAKK